MRRAQKTNCKSIVAEAIAELKTLNIEPGCILDNLHDMIALILRFICADDQKHYFSGPADRARVGAKR